MGVWVWGGGGRRESGREALAVEGSGHGGGEEGSLSGVRG
jgi:hypothetical protein